VRAVSTTSRCQRGSSSPRSASPLASSAPAVSARAGVGLDIGSRTGHRGRMDIAAVIVVAVFVFLTVVFVVGLFIWAAVKDGQADKAVQARLGIRRRTRMGR
jgi:hypothetical protein